MTTKEFKTRINNVFVRASEILQKKNVDYATDADPFLNFRGAVNIGITMEQGILVRMCDKFARLQNIIGRDTGPAVSDETAEDTLLDIINYAAILLVSLEQNKPPTEPKTMREILRIVEPFPDGPDPCLCSQPSQCGRDLCPYWPGHIRKEGWPAPVRLTNRILG